MSKATELDSEKLLLRVNSGKKVAAGDIEAVAELLQETKTSETEITVSVDDVYSYLLVLGAANASQHRTLLESYLDTEDPLTVSLVLEILCLKWEGIGDYLERVLHFALGVSWDYDNDVQQIGLKILGEYLAEHRKKPDTAQKHKKTKEVLELLLSVFRDEKAFTWLRQSAYFSLCRAAGKSWEEIPPECASMDFSESSKKVDWDMLRELEEMYQLTKAS